MCSRFWWYPHSKLLMHNFWLKFLQLYVKLAYFVLKQMHVLKQNPVSTYHSFLHTTNDTLKVSLPQRLIMNRFHNLSKIGVQILNFWLNWAIITCKDQDRFFIARFSKDLWKAEFKLFKLASKCAFHWIISRLVKRISKNRWYLALHLPGSKDLSQAKVN